MAEAPGRESILTVSGRAKTAPSARDGAVVVTVPLEITIRMPAADGPARAAATRHRR